MTEPLTSKQILALPMNENDADAKTIREYLVTLLERVWVEDEGFSGKRPFGNSGWQSDLICAVVKGDPTIGTFTEDDYGCIGVTSG